MFKSLSESILTLIYPQTCKVCGNSVENYNDGVACRDCWAKVRIFSGVETLCSKCGAYLGGPSGSVKTSCRNCNEHFYDRASAIGIYEHALAASVVQLKTTPVIAGNVKTLLLSAFNNASLTETALIVPVPLSRKRSFERGFNQAEVIGSFLSRKTGIRFGKDVLTRKSHTPMHRAAMDKKAREMSVKNAFEVADDASIRDANILLVDDVFTSGATVSNCAKTLKKHGAGRVDVLTLARAA